LIKIRFHKILRIMEKNMVLHSCIFVSTREHSSSSSKRTRDFWNPCGNTKCRTMTIFIKNKRQGRDRYLIKKNLNKRNDVAFTADWPSKKTQIQKIVWSKSWEIFLKNDSKYKEIPIGRAVKAEDSHRDDRFRIPHVKNTFRSIEMWRTRGYRIFQILIYCIFFLQLIQTFKFSVSGCCFLEVQLLWKRRLPFLF